ncbi:MAG: sensor histidine kinase [Acidimicrobiia bacterium]
MSADLDVRVIQPWDGVGRYKRRSDAGCDLVSVHTHDGRFLDASPAAYSVLGLAPEQLLDRRWQDLADGDDRMRVAHWWWSIRDGAPAQLTFRSRRHGEAVWLECTASVSITSTGLTHVHAVTRDVTRHRAHADELSRRCQELEDQNGRLEQANRDLLVLAADAAHDLRAPVQVITGFAELLAGREGARLDEVSQEFLAHILAAAGNMRNLVEAVLQHSRATSAPITLSSFDCGELVTDVLNCLRAEIGDRHARVQLEPLPRIRGDRLQLGRVFQNLVSNAVAAVPNDQAAEVVVSARRLPRHWELAVTDNGVGVAPDDRTRIFEAFQRGRNKERGGSGLGLAICKAVVERHGGRIWVEGVAGGGSRFVFTLAAEPQGGLLAPTFGPRAWSGLSLRAGPQPA